MGKTTYLGKTKVYSNSRSGFTSTFTKSKNQNGKTVWKRTGGTSKKPRMKK